MSTVMHHAYLNVTGFMCNIDEKCQVFFSIYDAREGRFIRCVESRKVTRKNKFNYHPNIWQTEGTVYSSYVIML